MWELTPDLPAFLDEYANWHGLRSVCLTVDIDFAPEYMIGEIVSLLHRYGAKATFYATHPSAAVAALATLEGVEVGLHPNLTASSTQGGSLPDIVSSLRQHYPHAIGNRFHLLGASYRDLAQLRHLGFEYDVSTLRFNSAYLVPSWHRDIDLTLLTYFWEDGVSETAGIPLRLANIDLGSPGVKIFNFHPLNVFLNGEDDAVRRRFLAENADLTNCPQEIAERYRSTGDGARTLLETLLIHLDRARCRTITVAELASAYPKVTRHGRGDEGV